MDDKSLMNLRERLVAEYNRAGNFKKYRLLFDIGNYNFLVEKLGKPELAINYEKELVYVNLSFHYNSSLINKIMYYIFDLGEVAENVIDVYKKAGYFYADNPKHVKLTFKEKSEILKDFLKWFCPSAYDIYKDLCAKNHAFYADLDKDYGIAFILQESDEYFLGINKYCDSDLLEIETYIHEIMHVYVHKFLRNYTWKSVENTFDGFYLETISMLSELELYRFFKENHMYPDSIEFHANFNDYINLSNYKCMKYLAVMAEREDAILNIDNLSYRVLGNNIINSNDDDPLYRFGMDYSTGLINSFCYGMSLLDAYKLQKSILDKDKNVINNYLISLQNTNKVCDDIEAGYDFSYMADSIRAHCDNIMKIYQRK